MEQNFVTIKPSLQIRIKVLADSKSDFVNGSITALSEHSARIALNKSDLGKISFHDEVFILIDRPGHQLQLKIQNIEIDENNSTDHGSILCTIDPSDLKTAHSLMAEYRKTHHIDLCLNENVESPDKDNGLGGIQLFTQSIHDASFSDVSIATHFLGTKFAMPFVIAGMTGGVEKASYINHCLAACAEELKIPMGIGSQRIALEDPAYESIFDLKKTFPNIFLIGNFGIGQLAKAHNRGVEQALKAIDMIKADALAIHCNMLQELVQAEGDRSFKGIFASIAELVQRANVPIIMKEVGCGMDRTTASILAELGVRHFDVGGHGGTSWSLIEGLRSADPQTRRIGKNFSTWGRKTADALVELSEFSNGRFSLIATGGMRTGIDAAKALALGADMVGFALPLLKAVMNGGEDLLRTELVSLARELKIALFCTGSLTINDFKAKHARLIKDYKL